MLTRMTGYRAIVSCLDRLATLGLTADCSAVCMCYTKDVLYEYTVVKVAWQ